MTIIEVNSCPTGNAFMASGGYGMIGYYQLIEYGFLSWLHSLPQNAGGLAVLIDLPKNFEQLQDVCDANMYLEDTYSKLYDDGKRQEQIYSILNRIIDQINNLLKSN